MGELIELKKIEYIKHKKTAKVMAFLGFKSLIKKLLIVTDKSRLSDGCLCEKCNTTFKGSYGVGYRSCENKSRLERL